jgi:hypothetical protein
MCRDWTVGRSIPIILMIVALIYVILVVAFLVYMRTKERDKLLNQSAIAACVNSVGRIGAAVSCRHESTTDNSAQRQLLPQ